MIYSMIAVVPLCVVLFALLFFPKRLQCHWSGQGNSFIVFQDTNRSGYQTRLWLLIPVWRSSGGAPNGYRTKRVYGFSYQFGALYVKRQTGLRTKRVLWHSSTCVCVCLCVCVCVCMFVNRRTPPKPLGGLDSILMK